MFGLKHIVLILCWIGVITTGAMLRFEHLSSRPFHCDEATGARITAKRMESGDYRFDPIHFHGPTLSSFAATVCKVRGEKSWPEMTKGTLRLLPAIAGTLLVLVPLLGRKRWGDAPMLLSAAFFATSPLLVYYSRMFIHESLLALFGVLAVFSLLGRPCLFRAGLLIGLMFATKESFVISIMAWGAAGAIVAIENRKTLGAWLCAKNSPANTPPPQADAPLPVKAALTRLWHTWGWQVVTCAAVAAIVAAAFYTDGFRHLQGAVDAVRTFFVYKTTDGHEKAFPYYFQLLVWPRKAGGVWWHETALLAFALLAYAATFRNRPEISAWRPTIRFLTYAAAGHFLAYSLIAYKTPWLACLPWAHVCLLGGFAVAIVIPRTRRVPQVVLAAMACLALFHQFRESRLATGRYASDSRNPYAYVPTKRDVENLEVWLKNLKTLTAKPPVTPLEPLAVVGSGYWPLPWYLRSFHEIGYWQSPPENSDQIPVVFATSDALEAVSAKLADTHTAVPRGLRDDVPITVFIRNDVWQRWMTDQEQ